MTAWQSLYQLAQLSSDQRILIIGGAGGCGTMAIQLAKLKGAYVAATCSSSNVGNLQLLGVDCVIDYTQQDFSSTSLLGGSDYDVVFDTVGEEGNFYKACRVLKTNGIYVTTVACQGREPLTLTGGASFLGSFLLHKFQEFMMGTVRYHLVAYSPSSENLAAMHAIVCSNQVKPIVDSTFPLTDVAVAHLYSKRAHMFGKVVFCHSATSHH